MQNTNAWESNYKEVKQLWGSTPDPKLMQYFGLIKKGNILDLGIGEGRNVIPFALTGFNIDGIDISESAIKLAKENLSKVNAVAKLDCLDIRNFHIKKDNYTLIIVANILNFFRNSEIDFIIDKIKEGLKEDGMIYISCFSILDPTYNLMKSDGTQVEKNTFYIKERDLYKHYFSQEEVKSYFSDYELICCCEGLEYDCSHSDLHYHGGIEFIARKKTR